jgi:hypothetical protein
MIAVSTAFYARPPAFAGSKMGCIRRHSVGGPFPLRRGSVGLLPLLEGISSKRLTGEQSLEALTLSRPSDRVLAPEAFQWTQRTRPTVLRADRTDLSCSASTTNTVRPSASGQRNHGGGATDPQRSAGECIPFYAVAGGVIVAYRYDRSFHSIPCTSTGVYRDNCRAPDLEVGRSIR